MTHPLPVPTITVTLQACTADALARAISIVDTATPTEELPAKPGVYIGQKITFSDSHAEDLVAGVGISKGGICDIREHMKKQMVKIGGPTAHPTPGMRRRASKPGKALRNPLVRPHR